MSDDWVDWLLTTSETAMKPGEKQIEVQVTLPSGRSALIPIYPEFKVQDLKHLAQLVFGQNFLKLLASDGQLLDPMEPLHNEDGACITAIALSAQIAATKQFFALWCRGGDGVLTWGCPFGHGTSGPSFHESLRNVQEVATTDQDFAALLADGSLVIWGSCHGYFKVKAHLSDVKRILGVRRLFVAVHLDGTCTCMCPDVKAYFHRESLTKLSEKLQNVEQLCASDEKYAALLADGDVLVGDSLDAMYRPRKLAEFLMSKQVIQLQSTTKAFCALFSDGEAIAFGDPLAGGDSGSKPLTSVKRLEIATIQAAGCAFAALLENGSVVTWGDPAFGGDSGHVQVQLQQVQRIYSTYYAFAALLSDQSVVAWGDPAFGGDCTAVQTHLRHVQTISGTIGAFAAIRADGLLLSWGNVMFGADSSDAMALLSSIG